MLSQAEKNYLMGGRLTEAQTQTITEATFQKSSIRAVDGNDGTYNWVFSAYDVASFVGNAFDSPNDDGEIELLETGAADLRIENCSARTILLRVKCELEQMPLPPNPEDYEDMSGVVVNTAGSFPTEEYETKLIDGHWMVAVNAHNTGQDLHISLTARDFDGQRVRWRLTYCQWIAFN